MFTEEFFQKQLKQQMDDFAKEAGSPAIAQFILTDGTQLLVRQWQDMKGCVFLEAVCEDEEHEHSHLMYVPYEAILCVELMSAL